MQQSGWADGGAADVASQAAQRGAGGDEADRAIQGLADLRAEEADRRAELGKSTSLGGRDRGAHELLSAPPPREQGGAQRRLAAMLPAAASAEAPELQGGRAAEGAERARLLYLRALARYDQDRFEDAAEDLRLALQQGPGPRLGARCWYALGVALANTDGWAEAEQAFGSALMVGRKCDEDAREEEEQQEEAALGEDGGNERGMGLGLETGGGGTGRGKGVSSPGGASALWHSRRERLCCYHERAKCRQVLGRHRAATADFTRVLRMEPRNAHALFRRGLSWRALREFERAACDFEDAKVAAPRDPNVTVSYSAARSVEAVLLCAAGEEPFYGPADPMPLRVEEEEPWASWSVEGTGGRAPSGTPLLVAVRSSAREDDTWRPGDEGPRLFERGHGGEGKEKEKEEKSGAAGAAAGLRSSSGIGRGTGVAR